MEGDGEDDEDKMFANIKKFKDGKPQDGDEVSDDPLDEDYEEEAGEFALYDSPLENFDELVAIKDVF